MLPGDPLGYLALLGRIVGLGIERPVIKALSRADRPLPAADAVSGEEHIAAAWAPNPIAACTLSFGLAELGLLAIVLLQAAQGQAPFANTQDWIIPALCTGVLFAVSFNAYVWAMGIGEVGFLTPLYALGFIWLYALDAVFGTAQLGWQPLAGVLCVTGGIAFLNHVPGRGLRHAFNPLVLLRQPGATGMLIYAFGLASGRVIDKSVADIAPPLAYALVNNSLVVLGGLAWLLLTRRGRTLIETSARRGRYIVISAVAGMGAYIMLLLSFRHGIAPSVAEPVSQLSVFIALGLGAAMFGEPARTRILPSALVVLGAILLLV